MQIFEKILPIKDHISGLKKEGRTIGFVPTMGALHDGHISLIDKARKENDIVVSSIFINPIQFNDKSDFEKYPRTIEPDKEKLEKANCDILFAPSNEEMYPEPDNSEFEFGNLDKVMEGKFRPGHFKGVAIVVKKLLKIIEPHRAYFGEKDYQQLLIIKKLTNILNLPAQIIGCPIVRESDGLAMSSRNARLSKEERESAVKVSQVLLKTKQLKGKMSVEEMKMFVENEIKKIPLIKPEYLEIADSTTLFPVKNWHNSEDTMAFIAFYAGKIRLIDNMRF
ncbi:MAG: pantoate--beta-alanine ligase [Bacteroidales bacterium]|nr:pantoate--beta-alanine ligase [Bacteroidales bacterium]